MDHKQYNFGPVLRRRRAQLGLSQSALAERSGVTQNYLSLVENGHRTPVLETLSKIAAALEVPVSYLVLHAQVEADEAEEKNELVSGLKRLADRLIRISDEKRSSESA